uniref:Uncharacterized protein n=1 Tax=Pseudictyota dubia TaxID=2749911 RepID=A0A7R9W6L6_9STRA
MLRGSEVICVGDQCHHSLVVTKRMVVDVFRTGCSFYPHFCFWALQLLKEGSRKAAGSTTEDGIRLWSVVLIVPLRLLKEGSRIHTDAPIGRFLQVEDLLFSFRSGTQHELKGLCQMEKS